MKPSFRFINVIEKMPAEAEPLTIGVSATDQVIPRSSEWKTRATAPLVANHTSLRPLTVMLDPLAANAASPGNARGRFSDGIDVQVSPSLVRRIGNFPSTGSLNAIPCVASQNAKPSKKAFGS